MRRATALLLAVALATLACGRVGRPVRSQPAAPPAAGAATADEEEEEETP